MTTAAARALPLAVLVVALGGCAQAVTGTPTANEAARAEQQQTRDCEAARTDLTRSFTDALRRAESDFAGGADAVDGIVRSDAPREFGRRCGPALVGPAYSRMLLELQKVPLTGSSATILRSSLLRAMCPTSGQIELTPEAKRLCETVR